MYACVYVCMYVRRLLVVVDKTCEIGGDGMYVYMYVYVYVCVCIYIYIYIYIYGCMYVSKAIVVVVDKTCEIGGDGMYVCMHVYMYVRKETVGCCRQVVRDRCMCVFVCIYVW